ncbi:deaminase [Nocardia cyriacigeorgica]|uniref:deoxycytidylate deaminase n=1 Tax=Nocardia cyriacigeorgica TaxID=135487 RepID=UPI00245710D5|nr:deaminase [Nocardia cyriacigeorgica]
MFVQALHWEGRRPNWDEYFLNIATAVALRSDCERDKVGAVVVKDKRIRSSGYNGAPAGDSGCITCPRRTSGVVPGSSYENCVAVHAEANALLYCDRADLIGATIYITREPCYACSKLIAGAGIQRIVTPPTHLSTKTLH